MKRLQATIRTDVQLQFRNGFYYAAAVVALPFVLLAGRFSRPELSWLLPMVVVNHLVVNGYYFVGGLVLLEKGEGTLQAQRVTPLRPAEYLAAKVATLALLTLLENGLIVALAFGPRFNVACLAAGVLLGIALFTLVGFTVVARYTALNEYLLPSIVYAALLALPLLPFAGAGDVPLVWAAVYLHPLQPILLLLQGALRPLPAWQVFYALLYGSLWVAIAYRCARRAFVEEIGD